MPFGLEVEIQVSVDVDVILYTELLRRGSNSYDCCMRMHILKTVSYGPLEDIGT